MLLAKIVGTVVATRKYEGLEGTKLLVVTPLDDALARTGADMDHPLHPQLDESAYLKGLLLVLD